MYTSSLARQISTIDRCQKLILKALFCRVARKEVTQKQGNPPWGGGSTVEKTLS